MQQPLRREWFFEQRDGNCRLMAPFAVQLAETAPTLARAVAPIAEWAAHVLWSTTKRRNNQVVAPPTRLTQSHKRETRGSSASLLGPTPPPQRICRGCGSPIRRGRSYCPACAVTVSTENMLEIAKAGRAVSHTLKPNHDAPKRYDAMWLHSRRGQRQANPGRMTEHTMRRSDPGSQALPIRPSHRRLGSHCITPRRFVGASAARISGIGRRSRGWREFLCSATDLCGFYLVVPKSTGFKRMLLV